MIQIIITTICANSKLHHKKIQATNTYGLLLKLVKALLPGSNYRRQWLINKLVSIIFIDTNAVALIKTSLILTAKEHYRITLLPYGLTGNNFEIIYLLHIHTERKEIIAQGVYNITEINYAVKTGCQALLLKQITEKGLLTQFYSIDINRI